jgi:hypothetical protein
LHAALESAHETLGLPERVELTEKDCPASRVTADFERLSIPPPAYPLEPHPVKAKQKVKRKKKIRLARIKISPPELLTWP